MSRQIIYKDQRFTVTTGIDHALGSFLQVFDKDMEAETPEGEGLVLDWSEFFGIERNYTGIPGDDAVKIAEKYLEDNGVEPPKD